MSIIKIKCATHSRDNGDGSSSVEFFPDLTALLKDFRDYHTEDECSDKELLDGEDTYQYGCVSDATIEVDTETGKLAKSFSVSTD